MAMGGPLLRRIPPTLKLSPGQSPNISIENQQNVFSLFEKLHYLGNWHDERPKSSQVLCIAQGRVQAAGPCNIHVETEPVFNSTLLSK